MPPPGELEHFVDADGAPAEPAAPATPPADVQAPERAHTHGSAPASVDMDINARYEEQNDAKQWAEQFERGSREVFRRRPEILAALGLRPGMRVADVGAGTGLFTLDLAKAVGSDGVVFAVDVQSYFLDHIGQKAKKGGHSNVQLVRATQESVKLDPASVDLVLMVDAYHHIEKPAPYLATLHAAIEPEGRLVIIDYDRENSDRAWLKDHLRGSADEFRAEIESAGFELVDRHEGVLEENFFFEFVRR